jgi:CRP-like cAMP-binding protein
MIEKNSKIAMHIIDKLCRRLQHATMQIQHIKRRDEPTLVALNLLYAFEGAADSSALPEEKTIEEISLALEAPAAEVRGIVEKLAAGGVILRERGVIRLADMEKLRLAAESAAAGPEPAAE